MTRRKPIARTCLWWERVVISLGLGSGVEVGCSRGKWTEDGGWESQGRTKERAMIVLRPAAMFIVDCVVGAGGRVLQARREG